MFAGEEFFPAEHVTVDHGASRAITARQARAAIRGMAAPDAVDWLLGLVDFLAPEDTALAWTLPGVRLTPTDRRVLYAIATVAPRIKTRESLMVLLYGDRHDAPDSKIIDVYVSRLRRRTSHLPFTIRSVTLVGWVLERHDPAFRFPWETAA